MEQDENGNRKITFEDPRKPDRAEEKEDVPVAKAGKPAEKCTGNDDKVEREIRKLKEQKKPLQCRPFEQIDTLSFMLVRQHLLFPIAVRNA